MTVLERSGSTSTSTEDIVASIGSKSTVALHEVIKYLQGENRQVAAFLSLFNLRFQILSPKN